MKPEKLFIRLSDENFREMVLENPMPVLVEIEADWSCSCLMMSPVIEGITVEFSQKMKVGKMNIEAGKAIMTQYGISTFYDLPIFLFFKNGHLVDQMIGTMSRNELFHQINEFLGINGQTEKC